MFLLNHALTGLVLAESIENQIILYPTAFASHFVLDSLPHFGLDEGFASRNTIKIAILDTAVTGVIGLGYLYLFPEKALPAAIAASLAAIPDFGWFLKWKLKLKENRFFKLHKIIQWGERRYGWVYEAIWASLMIVLLLYVL